MRRTLAAAFCVLVVSSTTAAAAPVQQGKGLFGQYCVACHGANGQGITKPRAIGFAQNRDVTKQGGIGPSLQGVGALAADFYVRTGYMPLKRVGEQPRRSRVAFTEPQIRALVAYVASLGPGPAIPTPHPERGSISQGMHLFTDRCSGCHQVVAQGGVVTGALPPALENATDVQVAEAVRIGPYVMPTFSKKSLSDAQLDSIIRYVDYTKHPDNSGGWSLGYIGPVPEGLVTWFIGAAALIALCVLIGKRLRD